MAAGLLPDLQLYIGGEWRGAHGRYTQPVRIPATGESLGDLPLATSQELADARDAAGRGFAAWRATAPEARAAVLNRTAALIRERADARAAFATLEQGKPLAEARGEVIGAAVIRDFHAGVAVRNYGRVLPRAPGLRSMVVRQPGGPVAAFCAWNFPVINPVRKISPALAAGCSVILKPSEETPASAIAVMRCFQDAGLPGDVAQLVFGVPDTVSRTLLASPVTRKLSFTGSVPVGKQLMRLASDTVMRMTMELGGHSQVLEFDDCDVEKTRETLCAHKFRNAGQVCFSPTRFYVQDGVYDRFAAGFAERTKRIKVGDGREAGTNMGPTANPRRPAAIEAMVENARSAGATLLAGGGRAEGQGFFFTPTVRGDVPLDAAAMNDEPFGPLALLRRFSTVEEAIEP